MLPFKNKYKERDIEVLVYNVQTHSPKVFGLNDLGNTIATRWSVDSIEFVGKPRRIFADPCYLTKREREGKSKGLVVLAKEWKLDGLRRALC